MLGVAACVDGVLAAADELSAAALDELGLIEAQLHRPRPWVDSCSFHANSSFLSASNYFL
jgi:hypothetical protein